MASTINANAVLQSLLGSKKNEKSNILSSTNESVIAKDSKSVKLSSGKSIHLKLKGNSDRRRVLKELNNIEDPCPGINMNDLWSKILLSEEVDKRKDDTLELLSEVTKSERVFKPSKLWTEKYRPRKFLDLLGNERINSMILKWLNDWKYCISNGKVNKEASDPLNRPFKKILLIHGPPGIGKTTIAHCIARQLRYEVHEINSSDERGGEGVKNKILNALKFTSLSGSNVLLILDEIDGASGAEGGFVRFLISLLQKDKRTTELIKNDDFKGEIKLKDLLRRPIIAICNDIYSPALEQLKPFCEIVSFKRTPSQFIKKRLKKICELEHIMNIQDSNLDDLILSMDGDIRNCINYLQFNSGELENGLKDSQIVWFKLLREIFQLKKHPVKFRQLFNELMNSMDQLDKINNGCFNGMLSSDGGNIFKISEMYQWLWFYDNVHNHGTLIEREDLNVYNCVTPLKFFKEFNSRNNEEVNFKSGDDYETRKNVRDLVNKMNYRNLNTTKDSLIEYELNMLYRILVPENLEVRNVEKLMRISEIIKKCDLRFDIEYVKSETMAQYRYSSNNNNMIAVDIFRPDVGLSVLDSCHHNNNSGAADGNTKISCGPVIKALKAHVKEEEQQLHSLEAKGHLEEPNAAKRRNGDKNNEPIKKQRAMTSSVEYFRSQYNNFSTTIGSAEDSRGIMSRNENRIWVKYHEGFSNAVRKEITWGFLFKGSSGTK